MNRVIVSAVVLLGLLGFVKSSRAVQTQVPKPKVWAIVVGIDRYEDALIPPSPGSIRDALAMVEWFSTTAGWGERQVLRMDEFGRKTHDAPDQNLTNLRPTRANLDWAVVDWLGHRVRKDDIVVLYFAGQATSRWPRSPSPPGRSYLLPIDARAANIDQTGWSLDETLDRAKALWSQQVRVVVWLDTSPSGRGPRRLPTDKGAASASDWLRSLTRWPRVTTWLAADGRAFAEANGANSSFVTSLIKSLGNRGEAHNLVGALKGLNDDPELSKRGFQAMGGVGPSVSLWSGGARVVEAIAPELIVQSGHGDRVTSVLISADNAQAITASQDSTVRVWSLADRALLRVLTDPLVGVEAIALDPDGSILIAGDGAGRVFGWDMTLDRPKPFYGPPEHTEGIRDILFLPDGKRFVTRDRAKHSILWDGGSGAIRKIRNLSEEPISGIASAARPEPNGVALASSVEPADGKPATIVTYDASAQSSQRFGWTGGRITSLTLSRDGRKLAIGDNKGKVRVLDLPEGKVVFERGFEGKVHRLAFSTSGMLLISDSGSLTLVDPNAKTNPIRLPDVVVEVDRAVFSNDGRWLSACSPEGRIFLWRLGSMGRVEPMKLAQGESLGLSPAFSPDGRLLFVGDSDGGLRSWSLPAGDEPGPVSPLTSIPPSRGKVAHLVVSSSGRFLLEITKDDLAIVWEFEEGRGCKLLPGRWISGAFLPDESKLILAQRPDQGGGLVVVERSSGDTQPMRFERPLNLQGQLSNASFGKIVVSKTGQWVAAASLEGQEPLACVWSITSGKLTHSVRGHEGGLTAIDLSSDEKLLLTASEDGRAKLWPLDLPEQELVRPSVSLPNPDGRAPAITSAKFCPGRTGRVLLGTRGGFVFLSDWDQETGKTRRFDLGRLEGEINSVVFSSDGRWVSASGSLEKSLRFWSVPEAGPPVVVPFLPRPHHAEQVGALVSWPDRPLIVSGGDDEAIRFWDLKDHTLIGTLVTHVRDEKALDWLAFTPGGLFDGSLPGEAMVKWRVVDKVVTLQQSEDLHHVFQLAGAFVTGEKIKGPELKDESPRLKIDDPGVDRVVENREVELILWTGDADPSALRLYQNGIPIKGPVDFEPTDRPHFFKTKVTLRAGDNAFYAMASKPGAIDGQTETRTLRYQGPELPGRIHTLAIGVSNYQQRPLKYANADARAIADLLASRQIPGLSKPGEQIILLDKDVTEPQIDNAFRRIRDAVKGRPEDVVVLFLAGHTDTDRRSDQFCLLLPDFSFQGAALLAPETVVDPLRVATRGNIGGGSFSTKVGEPGVLPYSVLYNRLSRLDALQRLIIVDACQAAAILEDKAVRNIQRLVDKGSRSARNSYLLAARRGEPAVEVDALKHGLLTYTLLHGLKTPGLESVPAALGGFPGKPSADLNQDGIVTSDELADYTADALPKLARLFPEIVTRSGGAPFSTKPNGQGKEDPGSPGLETRLKFQSAETSFSLIPLPR